jgi:hypothetical protein
LSPPSILSAASDHHTSARTCGQIPRRLQRVEQLGELRLARIVVLPAPEIADPVTANVVQPVLPSERLVQRVKLIFDIDAKEIVVSANRVQLLLRRARLADRLNDILDHRGADEGAFRADHDGAIMCLDLERPVPSWQ